MNKYSKSRNSFFKTLWILYLGMTSFYSLKAECYYSKYQFALEVKVGVETILCFNEISACAINTDSIQDKAYLISVLCKLHASGNLPVFRDRIEYKYCMDELGCLETNKSSIFKLLNEIVIKLDDLREIKVLNLIKIDAVDYIASDLIPSDTLWMNLSPVKQFAYNSDLCYNQVFIYEEGEKITQILFKIKTFQSLIKDLGASLKNNLRKKYQDEIISLIQEIVILDKVVVISGCTD